jgi:hypothetical protein
VLLVVELEHHDALETSPDFAALAEPRRRAERPRRRVSAETAALDCFACSLAPCRRNPRLNPWPETLDWGPTGKLRRPVPPQPLACKSPWPPDRDPTCQIYSSRPAARVCPAPLDQDPVSQIQPAIT